MLAAETEKRRVRALAPTRIWAQMWVVVALTLTQIRVLTLAVIMAVAATTPLQLRMDLAGLGLILVIQRTMVAAEERMLLLAATARGIYPQTMA